MSADAPPVFEPGTPVRVKSNPGRVGILAGEPMVLRGMRRWKVFFSDGSTEDLVPELALDVLPAGPANPFEEIARGRFHLTAQLRKTLTFSRLSGRLADLIYSLNHHQH